MTEEDGGSWSGVDSGGEASTSGICIAASETCSQGIGEDNRADESVRAGSIESSRTGGSAVSMVEVGDSSIATVGAVGPSCTRSEARIDSSVK